MRYAEDIENHRVSLKYFYILSDRKNIYKK